MLIIEGPDLVGKTTLVRALTTRLNELGWPHVHRHMGKPPDCWRQDPVSCYARLCSTYLVQDRFDLSELVYAPLRDAQPHFSPTQHRSIVRNLRAHCSYLVVVTAHPALIEQRYASRPEMFSLDKVLLANDRFRQAAQDGELDGYPIPVDLHLHCGGTCGEYPSLADVQLRTYTARLMASAPYPDAKRVL